MPKYLTSIDLSQNELKKARIENYPGDPITNSVPGVEGQIIFDSTNHLFFVHNGTTWIQFQPRSGMLDGIAALPSNGTGYLTRNEIDGWKFVNSDYLNGTAILDPVLDDLNAYITPGIYRYVLAFTNTPNFDTGIVEVLKYGSNIYQIAYSDAGITYDRLSANGGTSWTAWKSYLRTGDVTAPNDGTLTAASATAGATNTSIALSFSGTFSANTASNITIKPLIGPAITNFVNIMNTSTPTTGFIKKTGVDTFVIDNSTYLTAEADTLQSVTTRGATTSTAVSITNATVSTTTGTGALIITGGVGIGGNINVGGNAIITGDLTVNGTTTTINSSTTSIDDKNMELGAVVSTTVSATGTVGTIAGSGPWTAVLTNMVSSAGLIVGSAITATAGTGSLGAGGVYLVTAINSKTSINYTATGGTTPTAGTVTSVSTTGATDITANGGGITLKGTTDKTLNWDSSTGSWVSSENMGLLIGHAYYINNVSVLNSTTLGTGVINSSLTKVGLTSAGFVKTDASGNLSVDSSTYLTSASSLDASKLSGTIPSAVLGNSTHYIGTTAVALNRASAAQAMTGILSTTYNGSTSGTTQLIPTAIAGVTVITMPATTGTMALISQIPTVNDGGLTLSIGTAGATNTSVTVGTGTGFTANDATGTTTYDIKVGPAITNLVTYMAGAGNVGLIKKTAADTYVVDSSSYPKKYAVDLVVTGPGTYTVTHSLGTQDIVVSVMDSSKNVVMCDVAATNTTTATLIFGVTPATTYRVVVIG